MDKTNTTSPVSNAVFYMIKTDGTASRQHSTNSNQQFHYNGTSTVTMKSGPIKDVPTSISLMDGSAIRIWLDPSKTYHHFGNTMIFGTRHLICVGNV